MTYEFGPRNLPPPKTCRPRLQPTQPFGKSTTVNRRVVLKKKETFGQVAPRIADRELVTEESLIICVSDTTFCLAASLPWRAPICFPRHCHFGEA